ncbi:MAG: NYN domain-containing protein [Actinomycetia bacterium]|nr:NYN domain-containing protein [Actinomycetes bacterium]
MANLSLYLFDGSNLLHAGAFGSREMLIDRLASFVALRGARGVVVFDGVGQERQVGPLGVRFAAHADSVIEQLAAQHREHEPVVVVSSDRMIEHATGQGVHHRSSQDLLAELGGEQPPTEEVAVRLRLADSLDAQTREQLERIRRQEGLS